MNQPNLSSANRPVIACDMSALTDEIRAEHITRTGRLFASTIKMDELPNGYAFHLPPDQDTLSDAAKFIANERLCCPFLSFELAVNADQTLWLRLLGNEEIKAFIHAEFSGHVQ